MSSLVSMALRMTAMRALEGRTFAGHRVHDSAIAPIDDLISQEKEAFVVVSSEDESYDVTNRDVTNSNGTIDLVFEVCIAQAVSAKPIENQENPDPPEIVIPGTDAGLELTLTLTCRQIMRALFEQQNNPWCDLFRMFCVGVQKVSNRRGVGNKDGTRFAARQIILTVDGLFEPSFGHEPAADDPWGKLLAQMALDAELSTISPLIRSAITGDPPIADWDRGRSDQGLTDEAAAGIGIAAAGEIAGEEPPLASEGTME